MIFIWLSAEPNQEQEIKANIINNIIERTSWLNSAQWDHIIKTQAVERTLHTSPNKKRLTKLQALNLILLLSEGSTQIIKELTQRITKSNGDNTSKGGLAYKQIKLAPNIGKPDINDTVLLVEYYSIYDAFLKIWFKTTIQKSQNKQKKQWTIRWKATKISTTKNQCSSLDITNIIQQERDL